MQWFVEELNPFGEWSPCIYHGDKPPRDRPEGGSKRWRSEPVLVPEALIGRSLRQIAACLSADG